MTSLTSAARCQPACVQRIDAREREAESCALTPAPPCFPLPVSAAMSTIGQGVIWEFTQQSSVPWKEKKTSLKLRGHKHWAAQESGSAQPIYWLSVWLWMEARRGTCWVLEWRLWRREFCFVPVARVPRVKSVVIPCYINIGRSPVVPTIVHEIK